MKSNLLSLLLVLFVIVRLSEVARAQFLPPPGWEKVLDMDSLDTPKFWGINDSLVLRYWTNGKGPSSYQHTVNGGETWEEFETGPLPTPGWYMENSNMMVGGGYDSVAKHYSIWFSTDLGKTYHPSHIDQKLSDSMRGSYMDEIIVNPHNPREYFARYVLWGSMTNWSEFFLRSTDAGKTWSFIELPFPPDGDGIRYLISFDVRIPDRWYLAVEGMNHAISGWHPYLTTDNGKTFTYLPALRRALFPWSDGKTKLSYAGFDGPGTFRVWWEDRTNGGSGYYVINESDDTISKVDWERQLFTNEKLFDTSTKAGFQINPRSFTYSLSDPGQAFISAKYLEIGSDSIIDEEGDYVFRTKNNGASWEKIYESQNEFRINTFYLDQYTGDLYLYTIDGPRQRIEDRPSKQRSLLKSNQVLRVTEADHEVRTGLSVTYYPGKRSLRITGISDHQVRSASIYDIAGRLITKLQLSGTDGNSETEIQLDLRSGAYHLIIEGLVSVAAAKFMVF